jgi:translocation and assembly module TamB
MNPPDPSPPPSPTPPAPRRGRGRAAAAAWLGLAALAGGAAALWGTEAGTAWAVRQLPGLQVGAVQGRLADATLRLEDLVWTGGAGELRLSHLELEGLSLSWRPEPGAWLGLRLHALRAGVAHWQAAPGSPPSPAPTGLSLPLSLHVGEATLDRLQLGTTDPLRQLRLQGLSAGPEAHALEAWQASWAHLRLQGQARLQARAPLTLSASVSVQAEGDQPWQADVQARGPLTALDLSARLQGGPGGAADAARLDAQARIHPWAAWPVGAAQLRTSALDLSRLSPGWPRTRLDGEARLAPRDGHGPLTLALRLDNPAAGPWDQGLLPLASLQTQASATPGTDGHGWDRVELSRLQLALPGAAGQLEGQARWVGDTLQAELRLRGLQTPALDRRLAPWRVDGPATLSLQGLPSPSALQQGQATDWSPQRLAGRWQTDWQGQRLGGAGGPSVGLQLQAEGDAHRWRLERAEARAGQAVARLQGTLDTSGSQWTLHLQGALERFDPTQWWAGGADSPWRHGPHALNATWVLDGRGRAGAPLAGALGEASVQLAPSTLAGVPLSGGLSLKRDPRLQLDAQLDAAGNRLHLQGQAAADGAPRGRAELDAPSLAALAPLLRLVDPALAPSAGRLRANLGLERGPDGTWQTQGQAQADALAWPGGQLAQAQATWQAGQQPDAPLAARLRAQGLRLAGGRLDQAQAELSGTLASHRWSLRADSPSRPGPGLELALGTSGGQGSRLSLDGEGRWAPEAGGSRWQGRIGQLALGPAQGSGQWLAAQGLELSLALDPQGRPRAFELAPNQLQLPETRLRWTQARLRWPSPGERPLADLQATLDPFRAAPLLDRLQPELGWRGDLRLGGSVVLHASPRLDADIVFERLEGDLSVVDNVRDPTSRAQALGLSDLRLALAAHGGTWHFTHALAGARLGEMSGVATLRTGAERLWPEAQAPLDGVFQLRVANLAAWGAWVPPGWRLGGTLRSSAALGGRFGAPQFTGRLSGEQLALSHALLGVHLSEGRVEMALDGQTARIEQLAFRGGEGRVELSGSATMDEVPEMRFEARAERFQVLNRVDRRLVTSGQATLNFSQARWLLDGQVKVDEGLIDLGRGDAPTLDDDISFASSAGADAPAPRAPARPMLLKTRLDLGQKLRVRGRGLDTLLQGELLASVANGRFAVQGQVRARDGTYRAYGQNLDIERGELLFTGPLDDPRLDIFAVRPNLDVKVGVAVSGSALNPRVRLASEPEMSEAYKLSWLMLGREPSGLGEADTALLQRAAVALLAGEGEAPTDAFMNKLGITDFSLRQTTDTNDVRQTVVSLGRQLSRHWYVGYERGVNATTGTWQLIYRIAQRFTLRAQSGDDNAVDLIWSWRWP